MKLWLQRSRSPLNNSLFSHTGNGYPRESPTRTTNSRVSSLRQGQLRARKNCSWKGTFAVRSSERSPTIWISFLFACQNGLHSLNSYEYRNKGPQNKTTQHTAHPVHLEETPSRKSAGPIQPWPLAYLLMPCCIVHSAPGLPDTLQGSHGVFAFSFISYYNKTGIWFAQCTACYVHTQSLLTRLGLSLYYHFKHLGQFSVPSANSHHSVSS